jgi:adenylate cyclase class IV
MVVKTREVWRKENTVFHLDTVKGVGTIFEVELQKTGKVSEKDRRIFNSYQEKLLPFLGEGIKGSNVDLVGKKKK